MLCRILLSEPTFVCTARSSQVVQQGRAARRPEGRNIFKAHSLSDLLLLTPKEALGLAVSMLRLATAARQTACCLCSGCSVRPLIAACHPAVGTACSAGVAAGRHAFA